MKPKCQRQMSGGGGQQQQQKQQKVDQQQPLLLDRFEIVLANPEGVYFAGQEITGKVLIECREPRQVSEVLFEVKGRARTHWTKSRKTCSANEAYFCEQFNTEYTRGLPKAKDAPRRRTTLELEADQQQQEKDKEENGKGAKRKDSTRLLGHTLLPGCHQIPFSYTLPKHLPTSFEGDFGFVRYTLRAICERPWDQDLVTFLVFTVIGIEDLNQESDLLSLPLETRSTHPISSALLNCWALGQVTTELRLARGGCTPGEALECSAKVRNGSRRALRGLELRLCQQVVYKSKTFAGAEQQRVTRSVVQRVRLGDGGALRSGADAEWRAARLPVPSVAPRLTPKCRLIDVTYCVELNCRSPPFSVSLPLVLGSIPLLPGLLAKCLRLQMNNNGIPAATSTTSRSTASPPDAEAETAAAAEKEDRMLSAAKKRVRMPSSVLSELYPALPSPYYREVYSGPVRVADDRERRFQTGQPLFAPKYPFYE